MTVCDDDALKMVAKTDDIMIRSRKSHRIFKDMGPSNEKYISGNLLNIDMMLRSRRTFTPAAPARVPGAAKAPRFA